LDRRGGAVPRKVTSLGSGFVVDPNGFIVTNNHVIADADEITVTFNDGTTLKAELAGRDPKTDIALLRVKTDKPLPFLQFGDSDALRVGDWVLAIGNPFGLGGTVTAGIISARSRDINAGPYDDFLQTDAAINRGNSGGPLFDTNGKVIGVNTAIISPSGGSIGIGFAVPSNIASVIVMQLAKYGETRRGWLGVRVQTVSPEIAETLGLGKPHGALVAGVTQGGPADRAGIQPGDVIVGFDNKPINEMRDLPRMVADTPVGELADVKVWRKGEVRDFHMKLGRLEEAEEKTAQASPTAEVPAKAVNALGLSLAVLNPALRDRYDIGAEVKGVLVTSVESDGPASEKGIAAGDVLVEVAQEEVANPQDVLRVVDKVRQAGKKSILLLLSRGGDLRFVALRLEAPGGGKKAPAASGKPEQSAPEPKAAPKMPTEPGPDQDEAPDQPDQGPPSDQGPAQNAP
jgi:serine protease Do